MRRSMRVGLVLALLHLGANARAQQAASASIPGAATGFPSDAAPAGGALAAAGAVAEHVSESTGTPDLGSAAGSDSSPGEPPGQDAGSSPAAAQAPASGGR